MTATADDPQPRSRRDVELDELTEQIRAGVERVSSGEQWKQFLQFASSFHTYSGRNQLLMFMQKPNLTQVAGYNRWKKLGRQVRKGEKGLRILAPVTASRPYDRDGRLIDTADLDSYRKSEVRWLRKMVGVKPTSVFDVAQTDGDPLPEPPSGQLLQGAAPEGMWESLVEIAEDNGFTVEKRDLQGQGSSAEGYTSFNERLIVVRDGTDDAEAVATLTHEVGHMLMHEPTVETDVQAFLLHRGQREVEAESFTYIVAAKHGLDTSGYSFEYVNGWAGGDPDKVLESADRITKTARTVLDRTMGDPESHETQRRQAERAAQVKDAAVEETRQVSAMTADRKGATMPVPPAPPRNPIETRMLARASTVLSSRVEADYPEKLETALRDQQADAQAYGAQLRDRGETPRARMMEAYARTLAQASRTDEEVGAPVWRKSQAGVRAAFDAPRAKAVEASSEARLVRAASGETALSLWQAETTPERMAKLEPRYTRTVQQWRSQSIVAQVEGEPPVYDRGAVMRSAVEQQLTDAERDAQRRELAIAGMTSAGRGPEATGAEETVRDWESGGVPSPSVMMSADGPRSAEPVAPYEPPTPMRHEPGPEMG